MYDSTLTNGSTRSHWYSELGADDLAALEGDGAWTNRPLTVDVAIVGAGIAGLSVAYHLCKNGCSVAVFDKGVVGSGETGRTTAHLSSALDDRYYVLEALHGEPGAKLAAASHRAAIVDIEHIVVAEQIACGFGRVPGYLVSTQAGLQRERELERELRAAERAGLDVQLVHRKDFLWAPETHLCFPRQAQLEPLAYLAGLVRAIRRMGGLVYTRSRIQAVDSATNPLVLRLSAREQVFARDVVIATNTPIIDRFAIHTKQAPYRSYALAMALSGPLPPALLWDTGDPYHYVRLAGEQDVLIVGGEDHKVGQARDPGQAWSKLEAWARTRFPGALNVRARWSGQVLEPADGLAFIGRNPGISSHLFIASGDSGNGMTHGAIAGLLLSDMILGRAHPWSRLYNPARKPKSRALQDFIRENINVATHATTGYVATAAGHADIAPGTGRVVRRGLRRLAVYVAKDGHVHTRSAVCPHLGCIVQWNDAEKSWDCPCHGSRFDPYGGVLNGPAMRDLTPIAATHEENRNHPMQHKLLHSLSHELWQTEISASQHCRKEAERLEDTPPARALLSAAEHADEVLAELPKLALDRPIAYSAIGMALGKLFSELRDTVADKLLTSERSYRGTLLGLRHGVDLVQLMRATVQQAGDADLERFFDRWLERRLPIVGQVEIQLSWFGQNPELALEQARGLFGRKPLKTSVQRS